MVHNGRLMKIPGYRIQSKLGRGGMAQVYLATQESFDRQVAIKIMLPELAANPQFGQRFQREAKLCAQMSHPHIVPVYDVGEHEGCHYLSMEYVSGGILKERMSRGMRPEESMRVVREMALALHHAGEQDVIHRDIKPDNIMFRQDGSAVLMDFGIARPSMSDEQMTQMGTIVGTPKYMAPEQHRGKDIDPRADLYSLGVVFFEMLTGRPPFVADDAMALGIKHITEPVPLMPGTLKRYQPIIRKLLAKDPDKRFQTGRELAEALDELKAASHAAESQSGQAAPKPATPAAPVAFESAGQSDVKIESRMRTKEIKEKSGFMSTHYVFDIFAMADEFAQFQEHFDTLTQELKQWGDSRGKKAGRIQFKATVHPWIAGRVKEYIRRLRKADTHAFMQRIPIHVNLVGADGKPIEKLVIAPETEGSEPA